MSEPDRPAERVGADDAPLQQSPPAYDQDAEPTPPAGMTAAHALVAIAVVFVLGLVIGFILANTI